MHSNPIDTSATPSGTARLGRYRLVRPLSKGGMALVYEGRRESLAGVSPRVAIKIILPEHANSADFKDLFINEARLGASMHHQNLVQIQDFDAVNDTYFLVMEYVEGFTLRRVMSLAEKAGLYIPLAVIAEIGRQACDGLHYAHAARDEHGHSLNLVHRDVKPSNLILGPHGVVKILDFGISKGRLREERKGAIRGTWGYMAPEQATGGEVGPTCDLFGLAVVLYELAALQPMFGDLTKDEIRRQLRDDHAVRMAATLDGPRYGPLVGLLIRALQRDPAARFEHAEAFGRALGGLVSDPITARDEVTRFHEQLAEIEAGLPQGAPSESERSLVAGEEPPPMDLQGVAAVAGGATASLAAAAGLLAIGGIAWYLVNGQAEVSVSTATREVVVAEGTAPAADPPPAPPKKRPVPRQKRATPEELAASLLDGARPLPPGILVEPLSPAPESPEAPPAPPTDDAVAVGTTEPPPQPPEGVGEPPLATPQTESVYLGARQHAQVYVDGRFVDFTPYEGQLPVGRHQVTLVADDGRFSTFEITVNPGISVRRMYDFDRAGFR